MIHAIGGATKTRKKPVYKNAPKKRKSPSKRKPKKGN